MWIDERGSDVLDLQECRRLLALGAKMHLHGHLGIGQGDGQAPVVLPVDYSVDDVDVVVQVGEGLFEHMAGRSVAFQVDGAGGHEPFVAGDERPWSVLVRGLATERDHTSVHDHLPSPRVIHPGHRLVRIRSEVVTGRRLMPADSQADEKDDVSAIHVRLEGHGPGGWDLTELQQAMAHKGD